MGKGKGEREGGKGERGWEGGLSERFDSPAAGFRVFDGR